MNFCFYSWAVGTVLDKEQASEAWGVMQQKFADVLDQMKTSKGGSRNLL